MNVATILKAKGSDVETVGPDMKLGEVARLLAAKRIGAVLVMEGQHLIGILSERDIVKTIGHSGVEAFERTAHEIMTARIATCHLNDSVDELMDKMTEGRFRHLPVIENGQLAGIISIGDVVKHHTAKAVMETEALRLYISSS